MYKKSLVPKKAMLKSIRNLPELKEKVEAIEKQVSEGLASIENKQKEQDSKIETLLQTLQEMKEQGSVNLEKTNTELQHIKNLKEEFEKTLRRFQHEHEKSADTMFNSISNRVEDHLIHLKKNTQSFKGLEPEVKQLISQLSELKNETNKLTTATKKIKAMDFDLKNYAKTLKDSDNEKLKLMQDISNLKRLIAKERRRR